MFEFERRWATTVLEGFAPPSTKLGLVLAPGEVDLLRSFDEMALGGSALATVGNRLAVLLVYFAPWWFDGQLATMGSLTPEERAVLLERMLAHPMFVIREPVFLLKVAVGMSMLGVPSVRARSGYDTLPAGQGARHVG